MSKFYGEVGYAVQTETSPGVWADIIEERPYKGDVLQNSRRWQPSSDKVNDDLVIENKISIIADRFMYDNLSAIKYVKWFGSFWKISSIEISRPRLNLTIGGVYNGPTA